MKMLGGEEREETKVTEIERQLASGERPSDLPYRSADVTHKKKK